MNVHAIIILLNQEGTFFMNVEDLTGTRTQEETL